MAGFRKTEFGVFDLYDDALRIGISGQDNPMPRVVIGADRADARQQPFGEVAESQDMAAGGRLRRFWIIVKH